MVGGLKLELLRSYKALTIVDFLIKLLPLSTSLSNIITAIRDKLLKIKIFLARIIYQNSSILELSTKSHLSRFVKYRVNN